MRTLCSALALGALLLSSPAAAQSVAGEWDASMETPGGTRTFKILFEVRGDSLFGTVRRPAGDSPLAGIIQEDSVRFSYVISYNNNDLLMTVVAAVRGDTMTGIVDMNGVAQEPFAARRAERPQPR
jgi:hypothetical protein